MTDPAPPRFRRRLTHSDRFSMLRRMTFHGWGRTVVRRIGALAMCSGLALAGCGTLAVTEEPAPQIPARPIPARLGVHITGEALKKAFADPTRR